MQWFQSFARDLGPLSGCLAVAAAYRLALDGDFGIANGDHAEQQSAPDSADRGAKRKNTSIPL